MLYAVLAGKRRRSPYAIESKEITSNITLVMVNVKEREQVLPGLNFVFKKVSSKEMEPDLNGEDREKMLREISNLISRIKRARAERSNLAFLGNAKWSLIRKGIPEEKIEKIIWA